jgi:hypothetical protein
MPALAQNVCYDAPLLNSPNKHSGTREMIELLTLGKRHGWELQ